MDNIISSKTVLDIILAREEMKMLLRITTCNPKLTCLSDDELPF